MKDCPKPTLDKPIEPGDLRTGDKIGPFTVVANGLDSRSFKLSHLNANECPEHDWFSTSVVQSLIDAFGVSVHKPETPVMVKVTIPDGRLILMDALPWKVTQPGRVILESAIMAETTDEFGNTHLVIRGVVK